MGRRGDLVRVSGSTVVVGTQAVTLFLGLDFTCHSVQVDSDDAFGEKHELFSYHDHFSFSPYYLDWLPWIKR